MRRLWTRAGTATGASLLVAALVLTASGTALADSLQDTIADDGSGVTLEAGSATTGSASIRVVGNNAAGDPDPGCNIDSGDAPLSLNVLTPAGVTATPNPLVLTTCGDNFAVTFSAGSTAVSGTVTVTVHSGPAGGGTYVNQVSIPITITQPAPTNTRPTVSVSGVTNGASYEIGSVPTAICNVVDAQDGNSSFTAPLSGALSHGLGTQTATCNYTDRGGLAATTATASYTIVDTGAPTISHLLDPTGPNGENGWYKSYVVVDFNCADTGSGIQSCVGDTTIGEGANQSATGTATDWAGNATSETVSGISVDTIVPTISHILDPTGPNGENGWYTSDILLDFNCADGGSGIQSCVGDATIGEGTDQSATGTATDVAGNTASETVSGLNVDKTVPEVSYLLDPNGPNGANGWYTGDVTVDFSCTDGGSGVDSCVGDTVLGEGTEQSATGTATDRAGHTATATASGISVDKTDPTIFYVVDPNGPNGENGWYTGDVTVGFSCSDGGSGIDSCEGDTTFGEGADQSATGTATDFAGRTATATASGISVDKTNPTIEYVLDPNGPNGANGWYTGDVIVDFNCVDGGSGIDSCEGDTTLGEGTDQSATGTATDFAGRTASATASGINVDKTDPTIGYDLDSEEPLGARGWYTGDVNVDFSCGDGGSGIQDCIGDTTLGEGSNQSATGTATDFAGRTATATASGINVDKTDPTITYTLDPLGPSGDNGWYTGNVTVAFTCADALSRIYYCGGDTTLGEGANQSATGHATDVAGNRAEITAFGIKVDKTDPTVGFTDGPASGGSYYYGNVPAAPTCSGSDALSGLISCVITGGGTTVGAQTYVATATDRAGNTSTATLNYTVRAWTGHGFYSPVDMGANVWNTVKGGSTVPLKFEVFVGATELTSTSIVKSFTATTVTCPGAGAALDAIEFTTTGGTALRYDSTGGQFIQNWATPKKPGACVQVTMTTQDGSSITANFLLK